VVLFDVGVYDSAKEVEIVLAVGGLLPLLLRFYQG